MKVLVPGTGQAHLEEGKENGTIGMRMRGGTIEQLGKAAVKRTKFVFLDTAYANAFINTTVTGRYMRLESKIA